MKKKPGQIVKAAGFLLFAAKPKTPQFLLMRHHSRWDLPKGHCEKGESFLDTALRETEEETGISRHEITCDKAFSFDLVYSVTYRRWGDQVFEKQVRFFLGYLQSTPKLTITEHESATWFDWRPPHHIQAKTVDPLLAAVAKHFKKNPPGMLFSTGHLES